MRRVVGVVFASIFLAGSAAAGTPKSPLAAYGYHLYGEYCLSCHGANAAGRVNEPNGSSGSRPGGIQQSQLGIAPPLQGVGALSADFYLRAGLMPLRQIGLQPQRRAHALFSDHQIRALVAYIATFGGPKIPHPQPSRGSLSEGLHLFTEHCAGCHQVVAQGGYVTGALPPPLNQGTTPLEVAEAVRIGPYVMPTFTTKAISVRQLDSIVRYVEYANRPYHPGGWGLDFLGPVTEGLVTWFIAIPLLLGLCLVIGKRFSSS
jgi:ubiquinol-cytochrome c reductase cytochrome c subunit